MFLTIPCVNCGNILEIRIPEGAYLPKSVLGVGAYSRRGLIPEGGLFESGGLIDHLAPVIRRAHLVS